MNSAERQTNSPDLVRFRLACNRGREALGALTSLPERAREDRAKRLPDSERLGVLAQVFEPQEISAYLHEEDVRDFPRGCLVVAMTAIFGPELVAASVERELFMANGLDGELVYEWTAASRMKASSVVSALDFVAQMNSQDTVGALVGVALPDGRNHVLTLMRLDDRSDRHGRRFMLVDSAVESELEVTLTDNRLISLYSYATYPYPEDGVGNRNIAVFSMDYDDNSD